VDQPPPIPPTLSAIPPEWEERRQHAWEKIENHVPRELRSGRFLDIGCGVGNAIVAALQHGFTGAIGIDRNLSEFPWFKPARFDDICRASGVPPGGAVLIEADIFDLAFPESSFDCVLMLDSIEHMPDPAKFLSYAARVVRPGGIVLVDSSPLYYGRSGHHLFSYFPPETFPWAHLRHDFARLVERLKVDAWSMQRFHELNHVTHQEVRIAMEQVGLEIIEEERGRPTDELEALLSLHRPHLALEGIAEKLLFEEWLLLVGRKRPV